MKDLLAVSWEMPPMYGPRGTQVSRVLAQLPALGWRPTVVCLDPRRGGSHWTEHAAELPPGLRLLRVRSPEESFLVRAALRAMPRLRDYPDPSRMWVNVAATAATRLAEQGSAAMISFAQPWSDHLVGLRVHRATRIPWVAHFSDPWSDSPYATARQRAIWRPMEETVVRNASALVFVTEETSDLVMRKYPAALRGKIAIVPHSHTGMMRRSTPDPDPSRPLHLLHSGRFYRGIRTPSALLQALADLNRRRPLAGIVAVTFLGPHGNEFKTDAARLGLAGIVKFVDRVSASDAATAAAGADVLLVIDSPSDGPSVFLPSKLIDYLPFRKPILGLTPQQGASAQLLRRLGCPVVPPDDRRAIGDAVEELLRQWTARSLRVADAFDAVAAAYDVRCTARSLHDVLMRVVA